MDAHKYSIQKVSQDQIIMCDDKNENVESSLNIFAKFYDIFDNNFGSKGSLIQYNFEKIENEIALKFLANKKFLNTKILIRFNTNSNYYQSKIKIQI